ncbi:hypothetical protein [Wolbachia endosymbiont of Mansonella perstans]|uniref:hypothetical protein n=1 Tax=Wolbachia endosymbiont of Mansonella perstans TaxID=229526 RepID=UPI001CE0CA3B|nr:hypothetical protein [Wolbachia endosymbiont of Mansonella perstans]
MNGGGMLEKILDRCISKLLREEFVLVITSKIISIFQKQVVHKTASSKEELIKKEADAIVDTDCNLCYIYLTIKTLIPSTGIDESDSDEVYILYPKDVYKTAVSVWDYLRTKHCIKHLGTLIKDSNIIPIRLGVYRDRSCLVWV